MRPRVWTITVGGVALLGLLPVLAMAQSLPSVNLGFTSFLDGGPPAGPGFYFQEYIQYYHAGNLKDDSGNEAHVVFPDPPPGLARSGRILDDLDVVVSLNQGIYQSDQAIVPGGGRWGIDVIVPLVSITQQPGAATLPDGSPVLSSSHEGVGDVLIGPYIQWDPIMGKKGPLFMHRIELQNLVPVGKYDDKKLLNPGSNFYSFNPYWAATFFALPQWTISWRLHYLWNAKNEDPNEKLYPGADDTQAGEAIHVNFASEYEVLPKQLRVGINGYYLEQISQSKIDGEGNSDQDERVLGLGPGALYSFSQNDHVFFNAYFESEANSRPEGMRFNFRWTHHF
jgi:hypothetical protein